MSDFLPYPPLSVILTQLGQLNDNEFGTLLEAVTGSQGFERGIDRCKSLAGSLGTISTTDVFNLLSALHFLYNRCREWESSDVDFAPALRELFEVSDLISHIGEDSEVGFDRIVQLAKPNPTIEQKRKQRWLRTGILQNAVNFSSFIDLRPNFSSDRKTITELIPTIILRILTESDQGEDQSHVFQLTEDGLNKLRETIDDISMKLSTVQEDTELTERIHKDR